MADKSDNAAARQGEAPVRPSTSNDNNDDHTKSRRLPDNDAPPAASTNMDSHDDDRLKQRRQQEREEYHHQQQQKTKRDYNVTLDAAHRRVQVKHHHEDCFLYVDYNVRPNEAPPLWRYGLKDDEIARIRELPKFCHHEHGSLELFVCPCVDRFAATMNPAKGHSQGGGVE